MKVHGQDLLGSRPWFPKTRFRLLTSSMLLLLVSCSNSVVGLTNRKGPMWRRLLALSVLLMVLHTYWGFLLVQPGGLRVATFTSKRILDATTCFACRRNNKEEKQKRNRQYARKFATKNGVSRKSTVIEHKRSVVAANEAKFQAELFKLTTDDDMPPYHGFQFTV